MSDGHAAGPAALVLTATVARRFYLDGATKSDIAAELGFREVALPLVKPGIVTTAVLCLVFSWNDYAFASAFSGSSTQTLPIAATQLITQAGVDWGQLMAIGTVVVTPMILCWLAVRRHLTKGLTLGAHRGIRRSTR